MQNFAIVYEQIARNLSLPEELDDDVVVPSEWARSFDIDFESLRFPDKTGMPKPGSDIEPSGSKVGKATSSAGKRRSLEDRFPWPTGVTRDAIRAVIKNYQLYDFRPRQALHMGKVPMDMRLAEGLLSSEPPLEAWLRVDRGDPIFWRTLLEIFCRTFDVEDGAPEFWSKRKYFELACDAVFIREKLPKWSKAEAANYLARNKPYSPKYVETRAHMARFERSKVRGSAGIARRLAELEEWIGSLDAEGLGQLRQKDRALFDDVFHRALGLTWL